MPLNTLFTGPAAGQQETVLQAPSDSEAVNTTAAPSAKSETELSDVGHLIPDNFGQADGNGLFEDAEDAFFALDHLFDPQAYQRIIEWRSRFQTDIHGQFIFEEMVEEDEET